jgi:hypothetical protein
MPYTKSATPKKSSAKGFTHNNETPSPLTRGGDPRGQGNGNGEFGPQFLKIDPNSYVDVTVLCEPEEIISVENCAIWLEKGSGISPSWVYIGADDPSHELVDVERRYKAYLPVLSEGEVRIFSMSKKIHSDMLEVADAIGGEFRGQNIRIKRTGQALQTRYQIIARPTRTDVDDVEEVDIIPALGPLDREGIEKLICLRLNAADFDEVLERYEGKKITRPLPTLVKDKKETPAPAKPKRKAKPVVEEDEEEDEDLSLV